VDDVEKRRRPLKTIAIALAGAISVAGCAADRASSSPSEGAAALRAPDGRVLRAVVMPDLSKMTESVQKQIGAAHASLMTSTGNRATPAADLANAFGDLGKILLAGDYREAAEPCFLNAQTLAPDDYRWPYYLGHLYRDNGDLPKALTFFGRALEHRPDDVATLVWLGDLQLAQGRPDEAEPRFSKALSIQPGSLSAKFGLARTALAKQDFRGAIKLLEEVLAQDPGAAAAHYPLALAYGGIGDRKKADLHLKLREDHVILPADPLMVDLEELLESPQSYESRGIRALDQEKWSEAADLFRKGLALAPESGALHHRLGTALFMMNDFVRAQEQFEAAVRASPDYAPAQYSLGVLLQEKGRHAEAIERFTAALRSRSSYHEARLRLATSLRRSGRPKDALPHYQQILEVNSRHQEARLGQAMAYVQLGRYREARDRLVEAMNANPDQSIFAHTLARLLAAAPDDRVRDAPQAIAIVEDQIRKKQRTLELGETMAMALADLGRFEQAAKIQKDLITGAERGGLPDVARRLARNLALYERREPCRIPWGAGEMP
jgi:tetratricopeptide (TPR) repeat protein